MKDELSLVRKVCTSVMSEVQPRTSFKQLVSLIRRTFDRFKIELVIKTKLVKKLDNAEFYVNAYYDQESEKNNECSIEVLVYHNITNDGNFEHEQVGQFLVQIYDAVIHEFRHRQQSVSRSFKQNPNPPDETNIVQYLSDADEIDAYSLSIAIELVRNLGKERSIRYLHRVSRLAYIRPKGLFASPTLFHYFRVFESANHTVLRKLIKKVYLNLQTIDSSLIFY